MHDQCGRSLIEIIGVLAIAGVMAAASVRMYTMIRANQTRRIASAQLAQVVENTKLLMEARGDYTGLSVEYLVKAGALTNMRAPIGDEWTVRAASDPTAFEMTISGLSEGECDWFENTPPTWAAVMRVNGIDAAPGVDQCFSSATNQITFIVQ